MVGIVIRPTQYYVLQGVPAFRSANIREDGITDFDLVFISEDSNNLLAKSQTRIGDILTVRTGYPGTSAVVRSKHAGCNCIDILITRPSKKIDSDYLAIWINSSFGKEQVLRNQGGLAQKHFNVSDMRELMVALPSFPEQRSIATVLSDMDALLRSLDQLIAKKCDLKQATMQQLLTGKKRLPGFVGEWDVKQLGDVADIISGGTPKTTESSYWDGDIKWCTPTDITGCQGKYLIETKRTISRLGLNSSGAQLLPLGSLLLCSRATIGEIRIADCEICTNQGFKSLVCHPGMDNEFLYYKLLTMKEQMKERAFGSTFLEISKANVAALELLTPPLPEQHELANVLSDMDTELAALEQRRNKTRALKQGMMQELLTGRTRLL